MTIVSSDSKNFISSVVNDSLLDDSIAWIAANLSPEEVFTEEVLSEWAKDWAENNDYIKVEK